ncbi:MAG: hypothetical protein RJA07_245 [Bacteroidota bacterium]|jgi:hypothetical protein
MNFQKTFLSPLAFLKSFLVILFFVASANISDAQSNDTSTFKPSGKIWGLAYGDFVFKAATDELNRGGVNQYTDVKVNQSMFQFRRIYLGYDYEISRKFSATFLLASDDNKTSTAATPQVVSGDLLTNNKASIFIKFANVTWKNIFKNTDLSFGQMYTPSVTLAENAWDYRCIERTISDMRRTPTYDFGIKLSGKLYTSEKTEFGYNAMVANGTGAKPENDAFKYFYGDVYAKLMNKKLIFDLYADYNRINWVSGWHHDRNMFKVLAAYKGKKITMGIEAFYNSIQYDDIAIRTTGVDTIHNHSACISIFAHGRIYKDIVGFFVRYDNYNPTMNNHNSMYSKYTALTSNYDPNTKEEFFTVGIDYSPISKIHIMPNVWYNKYTNASPMQLAGGNDLVVRLSLYYVYGK